MRELNFVICHCAQTKENSRWNRNTHDFDTISIAVSVCFFFVNEPRFDRAFNTNLIDNLSVFKKPRHPNSNANFLSASDFPMDKMRSTKFAWNFGLFNHLNPMDKPATAAGAAIKTNQKRRTCKCSPLFLSVSTWKKLKRYYLDNAQCVELLVCLEIQYTPNWMACNFIRIRKSERSIFCINTPIFVGLPR